MLHEYFKELLQFLQSDYRILLTLFIFTVYIVYYRKCRIYLFEQQKQFTKGKHHIGKTLPSYPNGWFVVCTSDEIKTGETKYVDLHGEHMAVFRGTNNKVYVLDAYCAHMGANLGINGVVTNESCVQCPFHGWQFDGETGNCVIGKDKKPKEAIKYEYDIDHKCELKEVQKEVVKIRKFTVRESTNLVYVWFHADEKLKDSPQYEPLDVNDYAKRLEFRGTSINKVNAHIQDIAENGGDVLHFQFVHSSIIPHLVNGVWGSKWIRGDDPDLYKKMELKEKFFNDYRIKILNRFLTEENKKYIGIIHLDNKISILGSPLIPFFSLTAFQVGPGVVYLFIKSLFFETLLIQHVKSVDKYQQHVVHDIYTSGYLPYWFSALQLNLEAQQVLNDGVIWDNKKFGFEPIYSETSPADATLLSWRRWFSQFYDGCLKAEKAKDELIW
jgi:cholesterol 7-dehydrogenase